MKHFNKYVFPELIKPIIINKKHQEHELIDLLKPWVALEFCDFCAMFICVWRIIGIDLR